MNYIPWYQSCLQIDMQSVLDVSRLRTAESIQKKIFAFLCEFLRRSEDSRELVIQIGLKSFHQQHKWGSLSGTFIRLRFPTNKKWTSISVRTADEIRNALAAEQTLIELFLSRSQVLFDGLPSSAEPGAMNAAAEESRWMISLLSPTTLEGRKFWAKSSFTGLSSFERRCEKVGHSEVFQAVSPLLRPGLTRRHVRFSNPLKIEGPGFCFQGWGPWSETDLMLDTPRIILSGCTHRTSTGLVHWPQQEIIWTFGPFCIDVDQPRFRSWSHRSLVLTSLASIQACRMNEAETDINLLILINLNTAAAAWRTVPMS
jgi:hypothetical protein